MSRRKLLRWLWGLTGLAWFLWIGFEDRSLVTVILMAALIAVSGVFSFSLGSWLKKDEGGVDRWASIVLGVVVGATVPLLAILLIFVKVSLHNHVEPDFSLGQVQALLRRIPVWGLAGGLFGMAAGLFAELSL
ncbi:MAG: hypothetical protein ACLFWD_06155 [Anaerolineales bacterium]